MSSGLIEVYSVRVEREKENGPVVRETWTNGAGELHRTDGPAFQMFDAETGQILRSEYRLNGRNMRYDGPCLSTWDKDTGKLESQVWAGPMGEHREHGKPARVTTCPKTGILTAEEYLVRGLHHRIDGPGRIHRDAQSGIVVLEEYYSNGLLHRDGDEPALIHRDPVSGVATTTEYYLNDELCRAGAPARITRDPMTGEIIGVDYYDLTQSNDQQPDEPTTP